MNLAEWGEELTEALADGPGAPALLSLAPCGDAKASDEVMEIASRAVTAAAGPCTNSPQIRSGTHSSRHRKPVSSSFVMSSRRVRPGYRHWSQPFSTSCAEVSP
jgi:hypothetical protein